MPAVILVPIVGCRVAVKGPFDKTVEITAAVHWNGPPPRPTIWYRDVVVLVSGAVTRNLRNFRPDPNDLSQAYDSWTGPANSLGTARFTSYYKAVAQNYLDNTFTCARPTADLTIIPSETVTHGYNVSGMVHCANNANLTLTFFSQSGDQQIAPVLTLPASVSTNGPPLAGTFGAVTEANQPASGNLGVQGTDHWGRAWFISPPVRFSGNW